MMDRPEPDIPNFLPHVREDETLYITDRNLKIVYVNEQWQRFAAGNNGQHVIQPDSSRPVHEQFTGSQKQKWAHIYRLLLNGRLPHYAEHFNASGPQDRRVFELRVTPQRNEQEQIFWLVHHILPVEAGHARHQRLSRQLDGLNKPEQVEHEYGRRIIERPVHFDGFRTARYLRPLEHVGGDLVWSCEHPDGTCMLVCADVMGHGREAAHLAASMSILLDEIVLHTTSPCEIIAQLNHLLMQHENTDEVRFATGLLFVYTHREQPLVCVSFGHHGPVFSRRGQVAVKPGLPVGITTSEDAWPLTSIALEHYGDRFLIFSDGIIEQFNPGGEPFGTTRLVQAFQDQLDQPLDAMLKHIVSQITEYRGKAIVKDDQTLIALELP